MMTDPRRYLIRMLIFLVVVAVIAGLLHAPLARAFMGNPALNGVILGALLLGIIYAFRQILRLMPERRWLLEIQKTGTLDNRQGNHLAGHGLCHACRPAAGSPAVSPVPEIRAGWRGSAA